MKKIKNVFKYSLFVAAAVTIALVSCKKDNNEDPEPNPNVDTELPTVIIQTPTTESVYSTIEESLIISGLAQDNNSIKKVQWSINNGVKSDATGKTEWTVNSVALNEGDNIFIAYAEDESNNFSSDTMLITKNKYLTFLGVPLINPSGVFVNEPTEVSITAKIASNPDLIGNSVELIEIDDNGNEINTICSLYDDGDLNSHGDEIMGDNVFSNIQSFTISSSIKLRVKAKTNETEGEVTGFSSVFSLKAFEPISSSEITEILTTHENTLNKLNEIIENNDLNSTLEQTKEWLESLPYINNVEITGSNIAILFNSGLSSGIIISQITQDGNITKGGISRLSNNDRKQKIPIHKQTRGKNNLFSQLKSTSLNENIILDKNVFIYEPFENVFDPHDSGDDVKDEFNDSDFDFNVIHLRNQECSIESLDNLTNFGFVYFDTHGSGGRWILTGQIVNSNDDYDLLIREGKVRIYTNILYHDYLISKFNKYGDMYAVSSNYFSSLSGSFPNSVIFNNSCESTKTNALSNAFISKGAKTYLGFDETVWADFAHDVGVDYVHNLVIDQNNTGEAFNNLSIRQDPTSPNANIEIIGSQDMYYSNSLVNGDFEYGDLTAWSKEGDGRVITQLSNQTPPEGNFMGIISTGLGYTTSSGRISQSFKVNEGETEIKIKWNFFSEEFLEYIGSEYQDYFKIIIKKGNNEYEVFNKTIDIFASEYSLIEVSPAIVFDQGDVYMTGWQEFSIDISNYQNENITLIILVGDVGDSIYDSAVLIDDITIE